MDLTRNLKLPQYSEEDIFDLQDINKAYNDMDNAYEEIINFKEEIPKVNANAEIIEARDGEETLGAKIRKFNEQLDTKANEYYTDVTTLGCDNTGINDVSSILNNCSIKNNTLYFPTGIYKLDNILQFTKDINLIGDNAIIKGKALTGNNIKIKITGLHFLDSYTSSIALNTCDVVLEKNIFENTGLSNSLEKTHQGCGAYLQNCNVKIRNNDFLKTRGQGSIILNTCKDIDVKFNTFNQPYYRAIELNACSNAKGEIAENTIKNCGELLPKGSGVGANGIYGNMPCKNVKVLNNTIINSVENGIEGTFEIVDGNLINGTGVDYKNKPTPSTEGICCGSGIYTNNTVINSREACLKLFSDTKLENLIITNNNLLSSQNTTALDINSIAGFNNVKIHDNKTDLKVKIITPDNIQDSFYKGNLNGYYQNLNLPIKNTPYATDFSHFKDSQTWICGSKTFETIASLKVVNIPAGQKIQKTITDINKNIILKIGIKAKNKIQVTLFKNGAYFSNFNITNTNTFIIEEKYFNITDFIPTDNLLIEIQAIDNVAYVNTAEILYFNAS